MRDYEINIKKDHLVIIRDEQGVFHQFFWRPAGEFSLAKIKAQIADFNEKHKTAEVAYTAELVTNKLAKEICAYRQKAKPLEDIRRETGEAQENIDNAVRYLEIALSRLNSIRGLD
jgi:hypothetical protein